ncbi:MAG: hypothetical protein KIS67_16350 [Verrucomicrobiae bacterium]|nr:hypothetical protein [Verrucomicrobiae bacterium]
MTLALLYPILLGLGRIETSSFLHANGAFQYLTGLRMILTHKRCAGSEPEHRRISDTNFIA